jgi:histone-lysine N-methyltransferase SETMAR
VRLLTQPCQLDNFWQKNSIPALPKPPYTPDLSPHDFFLFPKFKITLKGRRFQTVEEITDANMT